MCIARESKMRPWILGIAAFLLTASIFGQSIQDLKQKAIAGDVDSMFSLGSKFESGTGVEANYQTAVYWYRLAVEKGNTAAMVDLGVMYGRGEGVPQSFTEEMRLYRLASDKGNETAMYYLGKMYFEGQGTAQDYSEAMSWYRKSAEKGNSGAMYRIGTMYREGVGVTQDFAQAYFWLSLSCVDPPIDAVKERDVVAKKIPPGRLIEIQDRARNWTGNHPKIHWIP